MAIYKSLTEALKNRDNCTTLKLQIKTDIFPLEVFTLKNMYELFIDAPQLKELPDMIGGLRSLRVLSLKAPRFSGCVSDLFLLPKLVNLKIIETPIQQLDLSLGAPLAPLESFTIKKCGLKRLPQEIGRLTSLVEMSLPENQLTQLPESLSKLVLLARLNLDHNAFSEFPDFIHQHPQLRHLSIDHNKFSSTEKARIQRQFNLTPN